MGKIIAIIIIGAIAYFVWPSLDFDGAKQNAIETMKQEKTIQAVTKSRQKNQARIYDALDGE